MPYELSYAGFPHIVEAILRHTSGADVYNFRLVGRDWRDFIDKVFFTHHLILRQDSPATAAIFAPRPDAIKWLRVPAREALRPDSWVQGNPPPMDKTRILDICGYFSPSCDLTPLGAAFPKLDMLRMLTCPHGAFTPYIPFAADTVVLFTNTNGESCAPQTCARAKALANEAWASGTTHLPAGAPAAIPEGCKKLVINLKGTGVPIPKLYPMVERPLATLKELVVVLPMHTVSDTRGWVHERGIEQMMQVIAGIAELIAVHEHAKIVLVGMEELGPERPRPFRAQLTEQPGEFYNHLVTALCIRLVLADFRDDAAATGFPNLNPDHASIQRHAVTTFPRAEEIIGSVEFLTHAEYAANVGEDRCKFETVEYIH